DHVHLNLCTLAKPDFWEKNFDGKNGVKWTEAALATMGWSMKHGVYDQRRIRGRGCWLDRRSANQEQDDIILHAGDCLYVNGIRTELGDYDSNQVYEASNRIVVPNLRSATADDGHALLQLFDSIELVHPMHCRMLAGWCIVASVCGILPWRPHIWPSGESGAGKGWIMDNLIDPLLGDSAIAVQAATTEAGIRQTLHRDALAIIADEQESENAVGELRVARMLELARASSRDRAAIVKGSSSGDAIAYSIRSCFIFASIGVAAALAADVSRITHLELIKRAQHVRTRELMGQTLSRPGFADSIRARAISLARQIRHNCTVLSDVLSERVGTRRGGDQLVALTAGFHILT